MEKNQPGQWGSGSVAENVDFLFGFFTVHRACFHCFMRWGGGSHVLAVEGPLALLIMLLWGAYTGSGEMFLYIPVWLGAVVVNRVVWFVNYLRGYRYHSKYQGYPWLAVFLVRNETLAHWVEPFICLIAGQALCDLGMRVLGKFIMAGFVSMGLVLVFSDLAWRKRLREIGDAQHEQTFLANEVRRR